MHSPKLFVVLTSIICLAGGPAGANTNFTVLNDDAGWCWFEDERVLVCDGKLIAGTVANGSHDKSRHGDIDVASYDLASGKETSASTIFFADWTVRSNRLGCFRMTWARHGRRVDWLSVFQQQ